jgi:antitoxin PrlF
MSIARSRITAQGQVSVPAEVRRKLGVGPGSVLEWKEQDDAIVVRRAGTYTSVDVQQALFGGSAPERHSLDALKDGIRSHIRTRHARG